jgi:hypothetical protein
VEERKERKEQNLDDGDLELHAPYQSITIILFI